MPFIFNADPLNSPVNTPDAIRRYREDRAPTSADYKQFVLGDEWLDTTSTDWWKLCARTSTSGTWRKMAGTSAASEQFLPDIGTSPIIPNATNQVFTSGGNGIQTVGTLNTLTVDMASPFNGNFAFTNSTAATVQYLACVNTDTDPGSTAIIAVSTPPLGGDAFLLWEISGGTRYFSMGIDNSDSDYFKLTHQVDPSSGNDLFIVNPDIFQWIFPVWEVSQQLSRNAQPVWHNIYNSHNASVNSEAFLRVTTGGGTGGNPYVNFLINGLTTFSAGMDNAAAGDPFKITTGANPSVGTVGVIMDSTGAVQLPVSIDSPVHTINTNYHIVKQYDIPVVGDGVYYIATSNTDILDGYFTVTWAGNNRRDTFEAVVIANRYNMYGFMSILSRATYNNEVCFTNIELAYESDAAAPIHDLIYLRLTLGNRNGAAGVIRVMWHGSNDNITMPALVPVTPLLLPTTGIIMTNEGQFTLPRQQALSVYQSAVAANVTGNAAVHTVLFDGIITNTWPANYNAGTGVLTASTTGNYLFNVSVMLMNNVAATTAILMIVTTGGSWEITSGFNNSWNATNDKTYTISQVIPMTAGDTAHINVIANGAGANTVSVGGSASPYTTFMSINLIS